MRLIDADELKKALSDKDLITWTHEYGDAIPFDWAISTLDNAPTVLEITEHDITDFYPKNILRPQGEWIKLRDYDFKCSVCGYSLMDKYNFCPECGADMRGDKV